MGNFISPDATVDGFPVAPALRKLESRAKAIFLLPLYPFRFLLSFYDKPLALQVEHAANSLPFEDRRNLIETLETERSELSNSILRFTESLEDLRVREQVFDERLREIDQLQKVCEAGQSDSKPQREDGSDTEHESSTSDSGESSAERENFEKKIADVSTQVLRGRAGIQSERARLTDRLTELEQQRDELEDSVAVMREAEETAVAASLASAEGAEGRLGLS